MSEEKQTKKVKIQRTGPAKRARNRAMALEVAAGKTVQDVAKKYGMNRTHVSKILNSDETKDLLLKAENRIKTLIDQAIDRLQAEVDDRLNGPTGLKAALAILESHGIVRKTMKLEHTFPRPVVIDYGDGKREVFTTSREEEATLPNETDPTPEREDDRSP